MCQHSSSAQSYFQNVTFVLWPAVNSSQTKEEPSCRAGCGRIATIDNECQFGALVKLLADNNTPLAWLGLQVSD